MYTIIKHVKNNRTGNQSKVRLVNSDHEILEFETESETLKYCEMFDVNSESGHLYEIRKIY
jgi:hypothetical protein